jgi:hypothetical protein
MDMIFNRQKNQVDSQDGLTNKGYTASPPAVSLPKGGGAIKGRGKKFAANPVTGIGFMSVLNATRLGSSGFGSQLSLFIHSEKSHYVC